MRIFFVLLTIAALLSMIWGFLLFVFIGIMLFVQIYRWIFLYKKPQTYTPINITKIPRNSQQTDEKLIKRLYTKYFDRYTKWEKIHHHLDGMIVVNGKSMFRYIDVYKRYDKHADIDEIKDVYINRNDYNVWSW